MTQRSTKHPSNIPASIKRDRKIVRLVSEWRNGLERFAFLQRRVDPYDPMRSKKEKDRTRERKTLARDLRELERDLLFRLGECTQHPDLYIPETPLPQPTVTFPLDIMFHSQDTPQEHRRKERAQNTIIREQRTRIHQTPFDPSVLCLYARLRRAIAMTRRRAWSTTLHPQLQREEGRNKTQMRHRLAQQLMDLEWKWLSALHQRVFPDAPLPPRRIIHPTRYK